MSSRKKTYDLLVTQKSELMQVNRLNTLLNSISDVVVTLNRYGRVTSQNAAAQAFFDTNKALVGSEIDGMLTLFDSDKHDVSIHKLISEVKGTSIRDDLSTGKGDDIRHLSIHLSRIQSIYGDTEDYGVVLIIRDITKQKTLEDEKDEFISVTSHELRTPVAIAEGSLSNFLLMQERAMPQQKLIEAAEEAHKQIIYLAQMINDLSTLSRAERGVGDASESINIGEMVQGLYTKYMPEAEEKSLKLDLDIEGSLPEIETSRLYLEEILQNFITNAIKYTKKGSVTIGVKMESDNKIAFYVKDTGIGMSKADQEHIFEKFYRSEDYRTRETSGTGLGLYVVEKLAAKLGTAIEVESHLNIGSTFRFVIALQSRSLL
jgi:PAS domain S-box-containing protein